MDQLNQLLLYRRQHPDRFQRPRHDRFGPYRWAFFSGKGGVGKSLITALTGFKLAQQGYRTLIVDGNFSIPSIQFFFAFNGELQAEQLVRTKVDFSQCIESVDRYLALFAAQSNPADAAYISPAVMEVIHEGSNNHFDIVLYDMPGGYDNLHKKLVQQVDLVSLVSTGDATVIANNYALLKQIWSERSDLLLNQIINRVATEKEAKNAAAHLNKISNHFLRLQVPMSGFFLEDAHTHRRIDDGKWVNEWPVKAPVFQWTSKLIDQVKSEFKHQTGKMHNTTTGQKVPARIEEAI